MHALQSILKEFFDSKLNSPLENDRFVIELKHFLKSKVYKLDPRNYELLKCTTHLSAEDEDGKVKITVLPHNLYSLTYFSTGDKPDMFKLNGLHDEMNQDPIIHGDWTLYFDKEEPIAINKNLGKSIKTINKFNL